MAKGRDSIVAYFAWSTVLQLVLRGRNPIFSFMFGTLKKNKIIGMERERTQIGR